MSPRRGPSGFAKQEGEEDGGGPSREPVSFQTEGESPAAARGMKWKSANSDLMKRRHSMPVPREEGTSSAPGERPPGIPSARQQLGAAKQTLSDHRDLIEALVARLLEQETVEGVEFAELVEKFARKPATA